MELDFSIVVASQINTLFENMIIVLDVYSVMLMCISFFVIFVY